MDKAVLAYTLLASAFAGDSLLSSHQAERNSKDYFASYAEAYGAPPRLAIAPAYAATTVAPVMQSAASAAETLPPEVVRSAEECSDVAELGSWRQHHVEQINKFVPAGAQQPAIDNIEKAYRKRFTELQNASTSPGKAARSVQLQVEGSSRLAQSPASSSGKDPSFPRFLSAVADCKTEQDLRAWHAAICNFVAERVPPQLRPLAFADVQKHYELRLSSLRSLAVEAKGSSLAGNMGSTVARPPLDPPARLLRKMFHDIEKCRDEIELRAWRQKVASHIRENIPLRFQIPALSEMQMLFGRRLGVLQEAAANAKAVADGKNVVAMDSIGASNHTLVNRAAPWLLVLAGLALPALISFLGAVIRTSQEPAARCSSERSADMHLLER